MLSTRFIRIPFAWALQEDIGAVNKRHKYLQGRPKFWSEYLQHKSQQELCYRNQARIGEQKHLG